MFDTSVFERNLQTLIPYFIKGNQFSLVEIVNHD